MSPHVVVDHIGMNRRVAQLGEPWTRLASMDLTGSVLDPS
jgi:hypothetical protein